MSVAFRSLDFKLRARTRAWLWMISIAGKNEDAKFQPLKIAVIGF